MTALTKLIPVDPLVEELRVERYRRRITQEELAMRSGYSTSAIRELEGGRRNPTLRIIRDLAQTLNYELRLCPVSSKPTSPTSSPSTTSPGA